MHDERLRQKPFKKPMRVKDFDTVADDAIGKGGVDGANAVVEPAEAERAHVDGAARRSQDEYEAQQIPDAPLLRRGKILLIQPIPRNRNLTDVIQQILNQNLHARHRIER